MNAVFPGRLRRRTAGVVNVDDGSAWGCPRGALPARDKRAGLLRRNEGLGCGHGGEVCCPPFSDAQRGNT